MMNQILDWTESKLLWWSINYYGNSSNKTNKKRWLNNNNKPLIACDLYSFQTEEGNLTLFHRALISIVINKEHTSDCSNCSWECTANKAERINKTIKQNKNGKKYKITHLTEGQLKWCKPSNFLQIEWDMKVFKCIHWQIWLIATRRFFLIW